MIPQFGLPYRFLMWQDTLSSVFNSRDHQKCSWRGFCWLVCFCEFVWICVLAHAFTRVWGQRLMLGVFLSCSLPYFFFFLRRLNRLAGQQVPRVLLSLFPMAGIIGSCHHSWGLCRCWGTNSGAHAYVSSTRSLIKASWTGFGRKYNEILWKGMPFAQGGVER